MKSPEQMMDEILFRQGRWATMTGKIMEANYAGRIDDLRSWRLEMLKQKRIELLAEQNAKRGRWRRMIDNACRSHQLK